MNVSFVRATPRRLACVWWMSSEMACAAARGFLSATLSYTRAERDCARAHVEQAHLDLERVAGALHRALDDAVGAELAPAIERDRVGRRIVCSIVR